MPPPNTPLNCHPRRLAVWGGVVIAVLLAWVAMAATVLAVQAARLPYNSEGRYFDGLAVHHDGTQWVYGSAALLAWVGVAALAWWARRAGRPRP
jgi:hypothetical protein